MKNKKVYGVVPPIVTPVDENEKVDEKAFRKLINRCIDKGIHGIFVCGSNGECMGLTQKERDRAIKIAIEEVGDRVPLIAGCMDSSTQRVIENIKRFEDMGGKIAVVTPVFYARHATQDETVQHFEEISKHTEAELMIYNIPTFTGQTLKAEFILMQGQTSLAIPSMLLGADGYVPSLAPLFPEPYIKLYEAGRAGNIDEAMKWGEIVDETCKIYPMAKSQTASTKYAMSKLGFLDKRVIRPTEKITAEEERKIDLKIEELKEYL